MMGVLPLGVASACTIVQSDRRKGRQNFIRQNDGYRDDWSKESIQRHVFHGGFLTEIGDLSTKNSPTGQLGFLSPSFANIGLTPMELHGPDFDVD
jgi:hypothetical protein